MTDRTYQYQGATYEYVQAYCYEGTSNPIIIQGTPLVFIIADWDQIATLDQIAINSYMVSHGWTVTS